MLLNLNKKGLFAICSAAVIVFAGFAAYVPTMRDTRKPPAEITYLDGNTATDEEGYVLLHETSEMKYFFRDDRDVIKIVDKRNGYTWKTGLDLPFNSDIDQEILDLTPEQLAENAPIKEAKMNTTYIGIANSLITAEYYDDTHALKNISSASKMGGSSSIGMVDDTSHWRLDVYFSEIDLRVSVHLHFEDNKIRYEISKDEISGEGMKKVSSLAITPFMGASGGAHSLYNPETEMYDIVQPKEMIPGYVFIPDGSGGLVRFQDNTMEFTEYIGSIYGSDKSQLKYANSTMEQARLVKKPSFPVFGIAHGDQQAAFVSYTEKGDEYMEIVMKPEQKMTFYNWAYPRFVINREYYQVYNKKGNGYFALFEKPNNYDISITYEFLQGDGKDGSFSADYVGMAHAYRNHLIEIGELEVTKSKESDVALHLDFVMSDPKVSVTGNQDVVVTRVDDVRNIFDDLISKGVDNINAGLLGWQRGGITLGSPYKAKFSGDIGKKGDFEKLIEDYSAKGIDVSLAQDFVTINDKQINLLGNAAKHISETYISNNLNRFDVPVSSTYCAIPTKSVDWLLKQTKVLENASSFTIFGMGNNLLGHYDGDKTITVTDTIEIFREAAEKVNAEKKLNIVAPNSYLWKYTDRYLDMPVFTSQYIIETDTVPFLQMVLDGAVEKYAPYANFSFYTPKDVLRMIDYNVYPSFVLTQEPSYLLAYTNSSDYFSTEYDKYSDLIVKTYNEINNVLGQVKGYDWADREVYEDGVIVNIYKNGSETKEVVINYTDNIVTYEGIKIQPISSEVIVRD